MFLIDCILLSLPSRLKANTFSETLIILLSFQNDFIIYHFEKGFFFTFTKSGHKFETFIKLFEKLCVLSTHNNSSEENRGQSFYMYFCKHLRPEKMSLQLKNSPSTLEKICHLFNLSNFLKTFFFV